MSATRYEQALLALAGERDDLVVMTAENRAAIRSLPSHLGPRFVDVGICEQTLVGAAAGLALRGRRPVVHALASFLTMRAFEFVRTDVGLPGLLQTRLALDADGVPLEWTESVYRGDRYKLVAHLSRPEDRA